MALREEVSVTVVVAVVVVAVVAAVARTAVPPEEEETTRNGLPSPSSVDLLSTTTLRLLKKSILTPSPSRSLRSLTSFLRDQRESFLTKP